MDLKKKINPQIQELLMQVAPQNDTFVSLTQALGRNGGGGHV